jgi:PhnB protein
VRLPWPAPTKWYNLKYGFDHGGEEEWLGNSIVLMVPDVDAAVQRAVEAGVTVQKPPTDMFWGDRYALAGDPFNVLWAFNGAQKK